jgi:TP901 family phage tail tape measure protein
MAAPVIIRVGCAIDTSVEKTFGDIERRAVRAGKRVEQAMRPGRRRVLDDGFVAAAVSQEKRHTKAVEGESKQRQRAFRAEANARRAALRDEERALRSSIREHEKAERARAKATAASVREQRRASRELDRFATRTSHRATRFFWPNAPLASMARRAGHDIMRGIGVDTTLSGAIGRGTQLQTAATALSTAGYLPGTTGPNSRRISAATLGGEARAVGTQFAMDPGAVIEAQDQFVKLTGDLDMSRKMMGSLAGLAIASGASLQDMATAAGEVSNAFGDMGSPEEKMKAIDQAMRSLAAQGKLGAVEMRDYARYMAHLGGTVGAFGGDRATRLAQFGAMTQLAKAYGGGTSAAVATRAVSGFRNILETPARRSKFREYGVAIEDEKGMLRDPFAIIRDALSKTGGKTEPLKEMFASIIGARAVSGLANIYKQAGGGDAGMAAVNKEFDRQMKADSMTKEVVAENVAEALKTTASKAQIFQNKLDEIAEEAAGKLIPALEALAPKALRLAEAFGGVVKWAAENPGKAIVGAIVASIARAGLESAFRGAVEAAILRAVRNVPTVPVPGGKPGVAPVGGAGGSGAAGPAAALAALGVGGALYELAALGGNRKGGPNQVGATDAFGSTVDFLTGGFVGAASRKLGGGSWSEAAGELSGNKVFSWLHDFVRDPTGGKAADAQAKREASARQAAQERAAVAAEALKDRMNQPLTVNVGNWDEQRPPTPTPGGGNPDGREPPDA